MRTSVLLLLTSAAVVLSAPAGKRDSVTTGTVNHIQDGHLGNCEGTSKECTKINEKRQLLGGEFGGPDLSPDFDLDTESNFLKSRGADKKNEEYGVIKRREVVEKPADNPLPGTAPTPQPPITPSPAES